MLSLLPPPFQCLQDVLSCKSCEHCGCNYTAIRKDGHTKLFISGKGHAGSRSKSALQEVRIFLSRSISPIYPFCIQHSSLVTDI